MSENKGKKNSQKLPKKRLNRGEKEKVCCLLAEGYSWSETAKLISMETGKDITRFQIKYYATSQKWIPKILEARKKDFEKASLVPITGLTFRARQYQTLFEDSRERYESLKNLKSDDPEIIIARVKAQKDEVRLSLSILDYARRDFNESRILEKGSEEGESEFNFAEIVESIVISRRRRIRHYNLARKAGLLDG